MDGVCKIIEEIGLRAVAHARGFAEGIEAAANWHKAEAMKLVAIAEAELLEGRHSDATENLNLACDHALAVPAIRALASPALMLESVR